MNARPKFYLNIEDAARVVYPKGWRVPLHELDEIEQQRAIEAREDMRRDEYSGFDNGSTDWEGQ